MEVKKSFYTVGNQPITVGKFEDVLCNLCGGESYRLIGTEQGFEIRQCLACTLVYVNPQPVASELPKFYEGFYEDQPESEGDCRTLGYIERHLRRLILRRRPEGGRLLEVGCGYGRFLEAMDRPNWLLTGYELSETALAAARQRVPRAGLVRAALEDAPDPDEPQDGIALIAVLEHVKDPKAVLSRICGWLAPGGLVVIQVPYTTPYLKLKRWIPRLPVYLEAPRHLFDFSPWTLPRYLEESGFAAVEVDIGRPYSSRGWLGTGLIWAVKIPGLVLHALTGGRYVYPFAASIVVSAIRAE